MTCSDMTELLAGYSAGELAPAQREFVELHLAECPTCRAALLNLELTRRQLEELRAERWQPDLTPQIMRAVASRPTRRSRSGWAGGLGLAVVTLLIALWQGALPVGVSPAGPPPGSIAHVVAGGQLLQIDVGRPTAPLRPVTGGLSAATQLAVSGGSRLLLSDGRLLVVDPSGTGTRPLAAGAEGILLGAAPNGRTIWLARNTESGGYALDAVDAATGELSHDPEPDEGRISGGFVSRDGRTLYLVGTTEAGTYLKLIDTATRARTGAYLLEGFSPSAVALTGPGEQSIYVVDDDLLAVARPAPTTGLPDIYPVPGLSRVAALRPDGSALVSARPGGGLILVDPSTRRNLKQASGPAYSHLSWSEDGRWLYAISGRTLYVLDGDRLRVAQRVDLPAEPVTGLSAR